MAYTIGYDIIVNDENVEESGLEYEGRCDSLEENIKRYIILLSKIKNEGIKSGAASENLGRFLEEVNSLKGEAEILAEEMKQCREAFLQGIDEADCYLY